MRKAIEDWLKAFDPAAFPSAAGDLPQRFKALAEHLVAAGPECFNMLRALRMLHQALDAAVEAIQSETVAQAAERGARGLQQPE